MIGTSVNELPSRYSSKNQFSKRLFPRAHLGNLPLDKTCPYKLCNFMSEGYIVDFAPDRMEYCVSCGKIFLRGLSFCISPLLLLYSSIFRPTAPL